MYFLRGLQKLNCTCQRGLHLEWKFAFEALSILDALTLFLLPFIAPGSILIKNSSPVAGGEDWLIQCCWLGLVRPVML